MWKASLAVADRGGGVPGAPPTAQTFLNFMQFGGKFGKIMCWHPLKGWRLLLRGILDPPLYFCTNQSINQCKAENSSHCILLRKPWICLGSVRMLKSQRLQLIWSVKLIGTGIYVNKNTFSRMRTDRHNKDMSNDRVAMRPIVNIMTDRQTPVKTLPSLAVSKNENEEKMKKRRPCPSKKHHITWDDESDNRKGKMFCSRIL